MEKESEFDYYIKICKSIEGLQYAFIEMKIDVADIKEMMTKLCKNKPVKRKKVNND